MWKNEDCGCDCEKCKCKLSNAQKWKYTLITTVIFLLVVMPLTYRLTNRILGKVFGKLCDAGGCPTMMGIFIHTIVFTLLLRYQME